MAFGGGGVIFGAGRLFRPRSSAAVSVASPLPLNRHGGGGVDGHVPLPGRGLDNHNLPRHLGLGGGCRTGIGDADSACSSPGDFNPFSGRFQITRPPRRFLWRVVAADQSGDGASMNRLAIGDRVEHWPQDRGDRDPPVLWWSAAAGYRCRLHSGEEIGAFYHSAGRRTCQRQRGQHRAAMKACRGPEPMATRAISALR